ncbi:MAG: hypothetical protein WBN94_13050 [Methanothrix sp.]
MTVEWKGIGMACSDCELKAVMPSKESPEDTDFISGITEGLEDFLEGRCRRFKDADELDEYLLSL